MKPFLFFLIIALIVSPVTATGVSVSTQISGTLTSGPTQSPTATPTATASYYTGGSFTYGGGGGGSGGGGGTTVYYYLPDTENTAAMTITTVNPAANITTEETTIPVTKEPTANITPGGFGNFTETYQTNPDLNTDFSLYLLIGSAGLIILLFVVYLVWLR